MKYLILALVILTAACTKEWMAIWKEKDQLKALKEFKDKHGLFLETQMQLGELYYLAAEGPCGDTFMSLVKDAKQAAEFVWEIDAAGKILREWQPGEEMIEGFDKDSVYRKITYFEDPRAFDSSSGVPKTNGHDFVVKISSRGDFELLPENHKIPGGWNVEETKCPPTPEINSEYKYCVKDKKSKRLFVLQHPCT
jgi:hypothetical protein